MLTNWESESNEGNLEMRSREAMAGCNKILRRWEKERMGGGDEK